MPGHVITNGTTELLVAGTWYMVGGHSELDILARLLCHQEHSIWHHVSDFFHHSHDLINLIKILSSNYCKRAFAGRVGPKCAFVEDHIRVRRQSYAGKWKCHLITKIKNRTSLISQHIRSLHPLQKISNQVELVFISESKSMKPDKHSDILELYSQ